MANNVSFEVFRGDLTEEDLSTLVALAKKRRKTYIIGHICSYAVLVLVNFLSAIVPVGSMFESILSILTFIPLIAVGIFAGFGAWTHNVICYITSRGGRAGGGLSSIIWAVLGGILIPLLVVYICQKIFPYKKVLGWGKTGITFTNDRW